MHTIFLPLFKTDSKWTVKTNLSNLVTKGGLLKLKVRVAFHKWIDKRKLTDFGDTRFHFNFLKSHLLIFRVRKRGKGESEEVSQRERDIDLLFHLFMCSLVDSCMCLDGGLNLQSWQAYQGQTCNQLSYPARDVLILIC